LMKAEDFIGKKVDIKVDRPLGSKHPNYDWNYPVNYGFVPGTIALDGKEIDAYVLGISKPVKTFSGTCIAVIRRQDDDDDKLVVVPEGCSLSDKEILVMINFQEKFFDSRIIR